MTYRKGSNPSEFVVTPQIGNVTVYAHPAPCLGECYWVFGISVISAFQQCGTTDERGLDTTYTHVVRAYIPAENNGIEDLPEIVNR